MAKMKAQSTRARQLRRFFGLLRAGKIKGEKIEKNYTKHKGARFQGEYDSQTAQQYKEEKKTSYGQVFRGGALENLRKARQHRKDSNKNTAAEAKEYIKSYKYAKKHYND